MAARGENPWTPQPIEFGGLRRFIVERCTCDPSPTGFLFIGGGGQNDRKAAEPSHSVPGSTEPTSRIFDRVAAACDEQGSITSPSQTRVVRSVWGSNGVSR